MRRPPAEPSANDDLRPVPVFALNKGGAKVTKCTKEQKDIMIASYDRQKTSLIKANPADVIQAMRAAGVSELKESQMKSWWSCYHRKSKQLAENMIEEALQLRSEQQGSITVFL